MTLYATMAMPDSQRYPRNLYLINNVEDIEVFTGVEVTDSNTSSMFSIKTHKMEVSKWLSGRLTIARLSNSITSCKTNPCTWARWNSQISLNSTKIESQN